MNAAENLVLNQNLKTLRLPTMLAEYPQLARDARQTQTGYETFLCELTKKEIEKRLANQLKRRLYKGICPACRRKERESPNNQRAYGQ